MLSVLRVALTTLLSSIKSRRALALENLALRHQLAILHRTAPAKLRIHPFDRALWVWLSRAFDEWREALVVVKPTTVVRWHRAAFRWFWRRRSRGGRPAKAPDLVRLIKAISRANPLWGAPRIQGELAKLGIHVAKSTVEKYMARRRKPPSPTWRSFLKNHLDGIAAIDFFVVPTATFRVLFVFVVLSCDRRRIVHFNVTASPSAEWTAQQIVNAFPDDIAPRFLMRDRDGIYGAAFRQRLTNMGIEQVVSAPRSPWQNPYIERLFGSIRRECLDHVIVLGENHLRRVLRSYVAYYNESRTHLSLAKDAPDRRAIERHGRVVALPRVGGLHIATRASRRRPSPHRHRSRRRARELGRWRACAVPAEVD
jgi:transposase InsO family protein